MSVDGVISAKIMPVAGGVLDIATLRNVFVENVFDLGVVEKVHSMPGQGVASTFKFGVGYGQLLGLMSGIYLPIELVTPQAWKKVTLAGTSKNKDAAIEFCRLRYPSVKLIPPGCRKPHDGIADALCILHYVLQKNHA